MCRIHGSTDLRPRHVSGICPFTIRRLNATTHLIREHDDFGEFPHIYAKLCSATAPDGSLASVLVITDTGVATTVPDPDHRADEPAPWTIHSFLEHTLNPGNAIPYLIITSHCHYDHILGLHHFVTQPDSSGSSSGTKSASHADATVVTSSRDRGFVTPWAVLNVHSLCESYGLTAPHYDVGIWADDHQRLRYAHASGVEIDLGIIALHTPGHTPDSLTWYDVAERTIYVGDSLYERESDETRNAPWPKAAPGPIMFPVEGDVLEWWRSVDKAIAFVQRENADGDGSKPRVKLAAGHITAEADAEECLLGAKRFMARILKGEVRRYPVKEARGQAMAHWTDDSPDEPGKVVGKFSVCAPVKVIEKGKEAVPKDELDV